MAGLGSRRRTLESVDDKMKLKSLIAFLILASICAPPATAWAHGVVDDYIFLEPLIADDPTPANELDVVQPRWTRTSDGRSFAIGTSIEKVLATDSEGTCPDSVSAAGPNWSYQSPKAGPQR